MTAPQPPQPLDYRPAPGYGFEVRTSRRGRGFLSFSGSTLVPGLGHLIARSPRRALFWFLLWLTIQTITLTAGYLPNLFVLAVVAIPANLIFIIWLYIDAYLAGRRNPSPVFASAWARYASGILLMLAAWAVSRGEALVLQHFVKTYIVSTRAMQPALWPGDRIFVRMGQLPRRWQLAVFHPPYDPGSAIIDRVVGLPGETVDITSAGLLIDGQLTSPPPGIGPYSKGTQYQTPIGVEGNPIHLASDEYFLLGDNTPIARDSRFWYDPAPGHQPGALPASNIIGTISAVYWPISNARELLHRN